MPQPPRAQFLHSIFDWCIPRNNHQNKIYQDPSSTHIIILCKTIPNSNITYGEALRSKISQKKKEKKKKDWGVGPRGRRPTRRDRPWTGRRRESGHPPTSERSPPWFPARTSPAVDGAGSLTRVFESRRIVLSGLWHPKPS